MFSRAVQLWQAIQGRKVPEKKKVPVSKISFSSGFTITVHLLAVTVAVTIAALNFQGLWVGSELTGQRGKDAEKLLALQLVAKMHELLMLASLSHIVFSITIGQLVFGDGLPFGAVTAGHRFQQISYLWSAEFLAACVTTFPNKFLVLSVIVIFTGLGVTVGPASATAVRPTLGDWPGGGTSFWLNATAEDLWPSTLSPSLAGNETCTSLETCGSSTTWNTLADNFFKYWGHETLEGIHGMPESVQIPGRASVRTLSARFRGPMTLYQPEMTAATIQPAAIADAVNEIRQIWLQANTRCYSGNRKGWDFCSYRDVTFSVPAEQPVVYVVCQSGNSTNAPLFSTLTPGSTRSDLVSHAENTSDIGSASTSSIKWVNLTGPAFTKTSVGAFVKAPYDKTSSGDEIFACSIDAQWANATVQSSFLNLPYMVNGEPTEFYLREQPHNKYQGRRVSISPAWAELANPSLTIPAQNATTPFDKLFAAADSSNPTQYSAEKIEAALAVLLAIRMADISSTATIQGNMIDRYQLLRPNGGHIFTPPAASPSYHRFSFQTTVTGYAFGLRTASGIATSTLASVLILLVYASIATSYIFYTIFFSRWHMSAWENMTELLALALRSDVSGVEALRNTSTGIETFEPLKARVVFRARGEHVEMVFDRDGNEIWETRKGEKVVVDAAYS
ncbi:hypothetical protein EPUS_03939 [Endocarpon pusillum Z07020]|uniref:Uncharacterized protein n=1 Tax=Endocarpon pusillum (strain Z07020 / HMAS-L-300199) TaxID=1263415 RepID=U1GR91_ENDPU|nr:uncharacterized protein EPUS_03939 [Endocarpon pusillum Z07020]ERF74501.1 hypothetical protein EPUS_03939 [Endocarpon pusillum Z07020]